MCRTTALPGVTGATSNVAAAWKLGSPINRTPQMLPIHTALLTFVFALPQGVTSLTQVYASAAACEEAREHIRQQIAGGRVVLLVCTSQSK